MAVSEWPITSQPRKWDVDHKATTTPTTRTNVPANGASTAGRKIILGGFAVTNPSAQDATIIYTDDNGYELWRKKIEAGDSDDKEYNMRPTTGLYVQSDNAALESSEWFWIASA